jgi:vitamin B12 transporter
VGAGSDRTFRSAVGVSGGGERAWYSANLSRERTDGFNSCRVEAAGVGGCFTAEPDRDGYDNLSGSVRAGYRFDDGAEFDVNWLRTHADSQFDGGFQNYSESVQQTLGVRFSMSPMDHWRLTLAAGQSRDDADNFKDAAFAGRFDTDRRTLSVQNDFGVGASGMFSVGVDHQDDRVSSTTAYPVTQRDNHGVFAFYQGKAGAHDYEIGLRSDDNEQFGTHNTGNVAWGYALSDGLRATAAYGTAFKAPSFNELYFPFYGNSALEPESARSLEFGLAGVAAWGRWSANVFRTTVDDLIAFDSSIFAANNVDKARIRGLEATLATRLMSWDLSGSLTLIDPENRSEGLNRGNVLPRRAEQTLRLDADRDLGAWRLGTTVVAEGRRYDDLANRNRLAGYVTVDLRAEHALGRDWRVQGTLVNIFDADYETARFYEQPGRGVFVTLTYQPQR